MKLYLNYLFALTILLTFSGCITKKACERKFPPQSFDSIHEQSYTRTIYRDTTIRITIPGDTVTRIITIQTKPNGLINTDVSTLKTDLAISKAWVKDGELHHQLFQPDSSWLQKIQNAIKDVQNINTKTQVKKEIQIVKVNELTSWQWFLIGLGKIALLSIAIYLFLLLLRKYLPWKIF